MAVKDLVGIYETKATSSPTPSPTRSRRDSRPIPHDFSTPHTPRPSPAQQSLAPSPARFIAHPLLRRREPSTAEEDDSVLPDQSAPDDTLATYTPPSEDEEPRDVADADVTDELLTVSGRQHSLFSRVSPRPYGSHWESGIGEFVEDTELERKALLSSSTGSLQTHGSTTLHASSTRAETTSLASTAKGYKNVPQSSSTVTLVPPTRSYKPHTPVPLSKVLARNAPPVSLPKLDEYISTLKIPTFPYGGASSQPKGKGKDKDTVVAMFPPMDRLQGTSLANLEFNGTIAPAWKNRSTIFSAITSITLGITVSLNETVWSA